MILIHILPVSEVQRWKEYEQWFWVFGCWYFTHMRDDTVRRRWEKMIHLGWGSLTKPPPLEWVYPLVTFKRNWHLTDGQHCPLITNTVKVWFGRIYLAALRDSWERQSQTTLVPYRCHLRIKREKKGIKQTRVLLHRARHSIHIQYSYMVPNRCNLRILEKEKIKETLVTRVLVQCPQYSYWCYLRIKRETCRCLKQTLATSVLVQCPQYSSQSRVTGKWATGSSTATTYQKNEHLLRTIFASPHYLNNSIIQLSWTETNPFHMYAYYTNHQFLTG